MRVVPLAGSLGAEVLDVDVNTLNASEFAQVEALFAQYHMLCFRQQTLNSTQQIAFARRFGEVEIHPIVNGTKEHPEVVRVHKPKGGAASFGTGWHTDNSFFEKPSKASVLYAVNVPPFGGDTLFSSMERAYLGLSEPMKAFLEPLRAVHSARDAYDPAVTGTAKYEGKAPITYRYSEAVKEENTHPVIRTHPTTGKRSIYVNPMFTLRIEQLAEAESRALLDLLFTHTIRPDFTCRLRWAEHSLALWDNRNLQHFAMNDYEQFDRTMMRVSVAGDRPR